MIKYIVLHSPLKNTCAALHLIYHNDTLSRYFSATATCTPSASLCTSVKTVLPGNCHVQIYTLQYFKSLFKRIFHPFLIIYYLPLWPNFFIAVQIARIFRPMLFKWFEQFGCSNKGIQPIFLYWLPELHAHLKTNTHNSNS